MALPIQKFREAVFQILYSQDISFETKEIIELMMKQLKTTRKAMLEAYQRACQIFLKKNELDSMIQTISTEYSLERISRVERTILRLGLYELFFEPCPFPKVVIAEAIRLCRKFGTRESAQFVNAILDGVYRAQVSKQPETI